MASEREGELFSEWDIAAVFWGIACDAVAEGFCGCGSLDEDKTLPGVGFVAEI